MHFSDFIGNRRIVDFFARQHAVGKGIATGTYIFAGERSVGKRTFANLLCSIFLGCPETALAVHPDCLVVERLIDEKTGNRKKDISVEQARDLKRKIATTSWVVGQQRYVIIDGADALNEESSNALLKLFEEPPAETVFFLIVEDSNAILPTIRSRAHTFHFGRTAASELETALVVRGCSIAQAHELAVASWGKPGRMFCLWHDQAYVAEDLSNQQRLQVLLNQPWYVQSKKIEEWLGKGEDARVSRDELDSWLVSWMCYTQAELVNQAQLQNVQSLLCRLRECNDARSLLQRHVNPRLVLEQLAERIRA